MSYEFRQPTEGPPGPADPHPAEGPESRHDPDLLSNGGGLQALEPPPATFDGLADAVSAGRTSMWCEAPPLDRKARAVGYLDVRGWAHCHAGIDAVFVYLGGLRYRARHGTFRPDLAEAFSEDLSHAGFELTIELAEDQAGRLELAVVAHGADGRAVGMRGAVEGQPVGPTPTDVNGGAVLAGETTLELLRRVEPRGDEAERLLAELTSSLSWRITRPLRWVGRVLRRR